MFYYTAYLPQRVEGNQNEIINQNGLRILNSTSTFAAQTQATRKESVLLGSIFLISYSKAVCFLYRGLSPATSPVQPAVFACSLATHSLVVVKVSHFDKNVNHINRGNIGCTQSRSQVATKMGFDFLRDWFDVISTTYY